MKTDALGYYRLKDGEWRYFMASGKDPLIAYSYHSRNRSRSDGPADPLRLYAYQGYVTTDRPAYRPGQTAHIYGVYSEVRMHAEDARVAASRPSRSRSSMRRMRRCRSSRSRRMPSGASRPASPCRRMVSRVTIVSALVRHRSAIKSSRLSSAVSSLSSSISARVRSSPSTYPQPPLSVWWHAPHHGVGAYAQW